MIWFKLTLFAVLLRLHLSNLILGAQRFAIVVSMKEMDACDELLRQLELRLVLWSSLRKLPLT